MVAILWVLGCVSLLTQASDVHEYIIKLFGKYGPLPLQTVPPELNIMMVVTCVTLIISAQKLHIAIESTSTMDSAKEMAKEDEDLVEDWLR